MVAAVLLGAAGRADAQRTGYRERVDTTVALDRGGTVNVSVYSGRVNVIGGSGSRVRVQGMVDRGEMVVRERMSSVSISVEPGGHRGGNADLDITVPVGSQVILEGFSAPFSIRGVKGVAKVESLSGSIRIVDAVGNVTAETVSGSIEVAQVEGDVRAEAVSGRVDLSDVHGDIVTESVSGSIRMTGARSKSVRAETVSGSVSYDGTFDPAGNYIFKSHSGRITLAMPADAGATVGLETFSGSVDSDFPVTLESGATRRGHESKFEFRIGNGRSRIVVETFSGDIRIQRGTGRINRE